MEPPGHNLQNEDAETRNAPLLTSLSRAQFRSMLENLLYEDQTREATAMASSPTEQILPLAAHPRSNDQSLQASTSSSSEEQNQSHNATTGSSRVQDFVPTAAGLHYKDQMRNRTPLHHVKNVSLHDDYDDGNYGGVVSSPQPPIPQAIPIIPTSKIIPVVEDDDDNQDDIQDDNQDDIRNQVRVLQEQMGQIQRQDDPQQHGSTYTLATTCTKKRLVRGVASGIAVLAVVTVILSLVLSKTGSNGGDDDSDALFGTPCAGFPIANTTRVTSAIDSTSTMIQGSLPSCLGQMTSLTRIDLQGIELTGTIPSQLGQLTALTYLWLNKNQFTGTIPTELGQLTALEWLWLFNNQLMGTIPSELVQLTALTRLEFQDNQLTGSIPSELGQLTSLTWSFLSSNQLEGNVPSELGQLTALVSLRLNDNQLTGTIPSQLGKLQALRWLWLQNNLFTGLVPSFMADIDNSDVSGNNFSS